MPARCGGEIVSTAFCVTGGWHSRPYNPYCSEYSKATRHTL